MAKIIVVEPVKVRTKHSVYLVTPSKENKNLHTVEKIEDLRDKQDTGLPVGWKFTGKELLLEIGNRMRIGGYDGFLSSEVLEVTFVESAH